MMHTTVDSLIYTKNSVVSGAGAAAAAFVV